MNDTPKHKHGSAEDNEELEIVISAYVIFLRRKPETKGVILEKMNAGATHIAGHLATSVEFEDRITKSIENIAKPSVNALDLHVWRSALIRDSHLLDLSDPVKRALESAIYWDQIDYAILKDEALWRDGV